MKDSSGLPTQVAIKQCNFILFSYLHTFFDSFFPFSTYSTKGGNYFAGFYILHIAVSVSSVSRMQFVRF